MRDEKIQKHPPQDSGGYRRRLKEEEAYKGFTLVELIVVIVILAILAAILIPGLLKWIDQAKDKKYELEAREIALAAEGALTKMYAQGKELIKSDEWVDATELIRDDIANFTDATVKGIKIYGSSTGSINGYKIDFTASDGAEITAELSPDTDNRWRITPSDGTGGENPEEDPNEDPKVPAAQKIGEAIIAVFREQQEQNKDIMVNYNGDIVKKVDGQYIWVFDDDFFSEELKKRVSDPGDVDRMVTYDIIGGERWKVPDGAPDEDFVKPWDGSFRGILVFSQDSDGVYSGALYSSSTDSWEYIESEDINEVDEQYIDWYEKYIY